MITRRAHWWLLVLGAVWVSGRAAEADIPPFVDFYASWSGGSWNVSYNENNYDAPVWQANQLDLQVDNTPMIEWDKEVWVEVEWASSKPEAAPVIDLVQPTMGVTDLITAPNEADNGFTWHWHIDPQPAEEWLRFPTTDYFNLQNISKIEVGTYCRKKTIHKPPILYGHLSQDSIEPEEVGEVACGPVSLVNSFVYLQQAYPSTYDRKLVPDTDGDGQYDESELIRVAEELIGPTDDFCGWLPYQLVKAKQEYVNKKAPGTTVFGGQYGTNWPAEAGPKPDWVQLGTPTWEWLYEQLVACEDVEIQIDEIAPPPGEEPLSHYVTLTSFEWNDTNYNNTLDQGEAKIDYIDPKTGQWDECNVWRDGGVLRTDYWPEANWISLAVKESVPEPATIELLCFGGLSLGLLLRDRSRRNRQPWRT